MATQKQNNLGIKNTAIKNGKVCIVVNYYDDNEIFFNSPFIEDIMNFIAFSNLSLFLSIL